MLRLAFDFIITWRETRTRPNAYIHKVDSTRMDLGRRIVERFHRIVGVR